jgi:hypothetical protein
MSSWEGSRRLGVLVALLVLGACAGPSSRISVDRSNFTRAPSVSVASVTAPVLGDGLAELASLRRMPGNAANELRRAYLLGETGDGAGALAALNRLLYGDEAPTAEVEALARYLRARISRKRGDTAEVDADLARAREITGDGELQLLIAAELPAPTPRAVPKPATAPQPLAALSVLPRSTWGARPARAAEQVPMETPYRITIHHSAMLSDSRSQQASAQEIFRIQTDHQGPQKGWADIGYHYLIDRSGRIWEGRPMRFQGAHADGDHNRGNIGVCLLGRFVRGGDGQAPSDEQSVALERLLRHLCRSHAISSGAIYFHRRFKATECPGPRLEAVVNEIRRRMERKAQS